MKNQQKVRRKIKLFFEKIKKGAYTRVSMSLPNKYVEIVIDDLMKDIIKYKGKVLNVEIGNNGDDFVQNVYTICVYFMHAKQDKRL